MMRVKEGFVRLLGENSARAVYAAFKVDGQLEDEDEVIAEYRQLWEMAKVSLPDKAVTYDVSNELGMELRKKGIHEEAKVFYFAALEGHRRVLGEEKKLTLSSLNNIGVVLYHMKDYKGALDYYQEALKGHERVFGKTHPDTLMTIMNMAITYKNGFKKFIKAEEMYRLALDAYEKSLGKDHEDTRKCAINMSGLYIESTINDKEKIRALVARHPHLTQGADSKAWYLRSFLET